MRPLNWRYVRRMRSVYNIRSFQWCEKCGVRIGEKIVNASDYVTMSSMRQRFFLRLAETLGACLEKLVTPAWTAGY